MDKILLKPDSPCLNCMNRRVYTTKTCHSDCAEYLEYKADLAEFNRCEREQRAQEQNDMFKLKRQSWYVAYKNK